MGERYQTALNALDIVERCLDVVKNADAGTVDRGEFVNNALASFDVLNEENLPREIQTKIDRIVRSFIAGIQNARKSAETETVAQAASLFREFAPSVGGFILRAVMFLLFLIFAVAFFLASRLEFALFSLVASASVVKLNAPLNALINVLRAMKKRK